VELGILTIGHLGNYGQGKEKQEPILLIANAISSSADGSGLIT